MSSLDNDVVKSENTPDTSKSDTSKNNSILNKETFTKIMKDTNVGIFSNYILLLLVVFLLLSSSIFGITRTIFYFKDKNKVIKCDDGTCSNISRQTNPKIQNNSQNIQSLNHVKGEKIKEILPLLYDMDITQIDGIFEIINTAKVEAFNNKNIKNDKLIENFQNENLTPEQLLEKLIRSSVNNSNSYFDSEYGNFSEMYEEVLKNKLSNEEQKNKNLKLDLTNILTMREQNFKRQVFLEVLLFNLVQKHKELLSQAEKMKKEEMDNSEKMKQVLYINQLLQNKINQLMNKKKDIKSERKKLNDLKGMFKTVKVGKKMFSEFEKMGIEKNIPNEVINKIKKSGIVHVLKV